MEVKREGLLLRFKRRRHNGRGNYIELYSGTRLHVIQAWESKEGVMIPRAVAYMCCAGAGRVARADVIGAPFHRPWPSRLRRRPDLTA